MTNVLSYRRTTCRLCGCSDLALVLKLSPTPPANAFVKSVDPSRNQAMFPLNLYFCLNCAHVQLLDVVDPSHLFRDYVYVSATSPVFVEHFKNYSNEILAKFGDCDQGGLVVDIGSNDGTLLQNFRARGSKILGIDPAVDIASKATENGIETIAEFFTSELAIKISENYGEAKIVFANNVFAHVDNLRDMVEGVQSLLSSDGIFVFEVSYLIDIFEKTLFDTIYHEHLSYHSVAPLKSFFTCIGMELIAVDRVESHGGSLRGVAQRAGGPKPKEPSVELLIDLEFKLGLHDVEVFKEYESKINARSIEVREYLVELKSEGKIIAGYGAPAKATTLMYHFNIGSDLIDFIVDDNPIKQGMFSPGMQIPILSPDYVYKKMPDVLLILAWNFSESIVQNHQRYLEGGGEFLVPLPEFRRIKL